MDDETLKDVLKQAAEIARAVPEQFQLAAFNRALDSLLGTAGHSATPERRERRGASTSRRRSVRGATAGTPAAASKRPKRGGVRPGPKAAVLELKTKGFFGTKRTITDVQEFLEKKRGHKFTLQDLSPTLLSLVRAGELDRDKNADGQYEYKAP